MWKPIMEGKCFLGISNGSNTTRVNSQPKGIVHETIVNGIGKISGLKFAMGDNQGLKTISDETYMEVYKGL